MMTRTFRAPVALGLVAILAASLVPASGADSPTAPFYTFHFGGAGQPTWTILKLNVTQPEVTPIVTYNAVTTPKCPMTWGTEFLTGSPGNTLAYNGLMFDWSAGRTGAHVRYVTPVIAGSPPVSTIIEDGATSCMWLDPTVTYGELPLGTVYMLQYFAGIPFETTSDLTFSGPGVTLAGASSGSSTFYINETQFGGMGAVVYSPPYCGGLTEQTDCDPMHVNPGGSVGASVALDRWSQFRFRHRPFYVFSDEGTWSISNATLTLPTGEIRYARADNEAAGYTLDGQGIMDFNLTGPSGFYRWNVHQSAAVGALATPGWHVMGADVWFPEEQK